MQKKTPQSVPAVKRSLGVPGAARGELQACFLMPSTLFLERLMNSGAVKIGYCKQTDSSLAYWKEKECHLHEHDLKGPHKAGKAVTPLWLLGVVSGVSLPVRSCKSKRSPWPRLGPHLELSRRNLPLPDRTLRGPNLWI